MFRYVLLFVLIGLLFVMIGYGKSLLRVGFTDALALRNIMTLHAVVDEIEQDCDKAAEWYRIAAEQGDSEARKQLELLKQK